MNKILARKIGQIAMAGVMALGCMTPMMGVAATDLTFGGGAADVAVIGNKSVGQTQGDYDVALEVDFDEAQQNTDNMTGDSVEQSKYTVYATAESADPSTEVYADKASSDVMVAVPKTIVLNGDVDKNTASTGEYKVAVRGNVDPKYDIVVKPNAKNLKMVNVGNAAAEYNASVTQDGILFNGDNIPTEFGGNQDVDGKTITPTVHTGTVSSTIKRAGSYKGTMQFKLQYAAKNTEGLGEEGADAAVVSATGADLAAAE